MNIPRKRIAWSEYQFPNSYVCERFIYSHDRSAYSAAGHTYVDRSWEYINRSQTHECGNWGWDWGRAIPRKGTNKWDFRCSACLEHSLTLNTVLSHCFIFQNITSTFLFHFCSIAGIYAILMCSPDSQPMVETQGTGQDAWGQPLQPQPVEVGTAGQDWGASQPDENIAGQSTISKYYQEV